MAQIGHELTIPVTFDFRQMRSCVGSPEMTNPAEAGLSLTKKALRAVRGGFKHRIAARRQDVPTSRPDWFSYPFDVEKWAKRSFGRKIKDLAAYSINELL